MKTPLSTRFELELSLTNMIFLVYGLGMVGLSYSTFTNTSYLHGGFQLIIAGILVFFGCRDVTVTAIDSTVEQNGE